MGPLEGLDMRQWIMCCLVAYTLLSTCAAQFRPCKFTTLSTIDHSAGIETLRVSVIEQNGIVGASVFIPDSQEPIPGIIFSHSKIHGANKDADLLRFAWALAQAGAASIVLDGVLQRQTPNDESKPPPHLMACAGQWLILHAKLDSSRLALLVPTESGAEAIALIVNLGNLRVGSQEHG